MKHMIRVTGLTIKDWKHIERVFEVAEVINDCGDLLLITTCGHKVDMARDVNEVRSKTNRRVMRDARVDRIN